MSQKKISEPKMQINSDSQETCNNQERSNKQSYDNKQRNDVQRRKNIDNSGKDSSYERESRKRDSCQETFGGQVSYGKRNSSEELDGNQERNKSQGRNICQRVCCQEIEYSQSNNRHESNYSESYDSKERNDRKCSEGRKPRKIDSNQGHTSQRSNFTEIDARQERNGQNTINSRGKDYNRLENNVEERNIGRTDKSENNMHRRNSTKKRGIQRRRKHRQTHERSRSRRRNSSKERDGSRERYSSRERAIDQDSDDSLGSDSSLSEDLDFDELFDKFCKFGDRQADEITLRNVDKWFKQANIFTDKLTTTDTAINFAKVAKNKKRLSKEEFHEMLNELAKDKNMEVHTLESSLRTAGKPSCSRSVTRPVHGGIVADNMERLTDPTKYTGSHKFRFDKDGKGLGLTGRYDSAPDDGYVKGYKNKGTYGSNDQLDKDDLD